MNSRYLFLVCFLKRYLKNSKMMTMKTIASLLSICIILIFSSCRKETYIEEVTQLGKVIEITADFNAANNFSILYEFPQSVTVYESDAIFVYLLEDVVNGNEDVWTLLPQNFFTTNGLLQYTYNHTFYDVSIFLDANFDLNLLPANYTQDKVFRIVIVPAEFAVSNPENYHGLMNQLELSESNVFQLSN